MSQLAVGYKESSNGREQRSDGYRHHLGLMDFGGIRAAATQSKLAVSPLTGRGLEMGYHADSGAGAALGYLYCANRDTAAVEDFQLICRNLILSPGAGGTLQMPASSIQSAYIADGAVTTPKIAANAVQQLIGSYVAAPTWTTTVNNWTITPVTTGPISCGPGLLRVEWCMTMSSSVVNGQALVGLGWDGAVQYGVAILNSPAANQVNTISGVWYLSNLANGTHTISMFVYNTVGGSTVALYTGIYQTLYVTEQKR